MVDTPFHDRDGFIWINGEMLPWREAKTHFLTHALHYGTQVFEGERAYDGKIFKSREHSERLIKSAALINMVVEQSVDELEAIKDKVLKANGLENAYIRAAAWRGSEKMGLDVDGTHTHVAVAAWEWDAYFGPEVLEKGISLGISDWRKPAPNTAPVTSKCAGLYVLGSMAKTEAKQAGFTDALMLDHEGFIAECTAANFFGVLDGALHTRIPDRFLDGITRQTAIELAEAAGISVTARRIKPEELGDFDEVFLTGTAAEITPVGRIDDIEYAVGPVTRQLAEAYSALVRAHKG